MSSDTMSHTGSTTGIAKRSRSESRSVSPDPDSLFVSQEAPSKRLATEAAGISSSIDSTHKSEQPVARSSESYTPILDKKGRVPGYDASMETLPPCAPYCPSFAKAESVVTKVCYKVINAYAATKLNGYHNTAIENVCGLLAGCRSPRDLYPVPGSIAVLGPAGSGKSSAMNSIMNQQTVAYSNDGDRGTYVVHEYRAAPPDQLSTYRVVATYYSTQDIMRDVIVYHNDVIAFLFDDESEEPSGDDDESLLQQKCETALCFFMDLLAHKKEFQTEDSAKEYFTQTGEEKREDICFKLFGFIEEFLASRTAYSNGEERYDVNTESEVEVIFTKLCRPFEAVGTSLRAGSPWPIIRKVVIYQRAPILDAGVILADTPGINDKNLAIVQTTKRYIKTAGTILIFLHYQRIEKQSLLEELLKECIVLGKMHNIRLVVTHIDGMETPKKATLNAEDRARLEAAEKKHARLLSEIEEIEEAKEQARGTHRFEGMVAKLDSLQLQEVKAASAVLQIEIELKCSAMRELLKGKIQAIDKSKYAPELPISFISNSQYKLHVSGYNPRDSNQKKTPFLDLQTSGIIQLRRDLFAIPTHGKLQTLRSLIVNRLPNILNGITGILTKSKLERIAEVRKILDKAFSKHSKPAAALETAILQALEKRITDTIKENLPDWKNKAQTHLEKWAKMHATTFKGFCGRGGSWGSHKTYFNMRWNHDLVEIAAAKLVSAFSEFDDDVDGIKKDFSLGVQEFFDNICDEIRYSKDAQGNVLEPFFDFVGGVSLEVAEQMVAKLDELKAKLDQCRHAATLDTEASYYALGMAKTYTAAEVLSAKTHVPKELPPAPSTGGRRRRQKKPTVGSARVQIIHDKLRGESGEKSIFLSVGQLAKDDVVAYMKTWAVECNKISEKGYGKIIAYFENHFQEDEVTEEDDPIAVEKIKQAVEEASKILKTQRYISECEEFEKAGK